jgi:hypothetical protein
MSAFLDTALATLAALCAVVVATEAAIRVYGLIQLPERMRLAKEQAQASANAMSGIVSAIKAQAEKPAEGEEWKA